MNNITVLNPTKKFFYSYEEKEFIKEGIKNKLKAKTIAKLFVQKFGRTETTVINRVSTEKRKMGVARFRTPKTVKQNPQETTTVRLPEGFTFSGTAKKVEISSDYFKIYF